MSQTSVPRVIQLHATAQTQFEESQNMTVAAITDADFQSQVLDSSKPVLVDYWAEWCGPCKMVAPILDILSDDMADKVTIVKMNVDENPNTPMNEAVRALPTLALYKNGSRTSTMPGPFTRQALEKWLNDNA